MFDRAALLAAALVALAAADQRWMYTSGGYTLDVTDKASGVAATTRAQMVKTFFATYARMAREWNRAAAKRVSLDLDPAYGGVAYTSGAHEVYSGGYMRAHPQDTDTVTHESFHVVQAYAGRGETPGWLVEGLADYARARYGQNNAAAGWSLGDFAPQQKWTDGYRVTARFLVWLEARFAGIAKRLDVELRAGAYTTGGSWENLTGKSVEKLWADYAQNPAV